MVPGDFEPPAKHCLEEHGVLLCPFCETTDRNRSAYNSYVFYKLDSYVTHMSFFHKISQVNLTPESPSEVLDEVLQLTCSKVSENNAPVCHMCLFQSFENLNEFSDHLISQHQIKNFERFMAMYDANEQEFSVGHIQV